MHAKTRNFLIILVIVVVAVFLLINPQVSSTTVEQDWQTFKAQEQQLIDSIQVFFNKISTQNPDDTCNQLAQEKAHLTELKGLYQKLTPIISNSADKPKIKSEAEKYKTSLATLLPKLQSSFQELEEICSS